MSIRRVRALTSGATNFYGSTSLVATAASEPTAPPTVSRGESLTHSAIAEPVLVPASPIRLPAVSQRLPATANVGILPAGAGSETSSPPLTIPVGAPMPLSSPRLGPRRLQVDLPDLPTRPAWPAVDGPKSPIKRAASARALADEAAAAHAQAPAAEPRDARTKRILSTVQSSLATAVADAIIRECSFYDHNHPGVVQLDVLARSLVRLVPGVTAADVQHILQAVGLPDVAQVKVQQRAKSYAARVAAELGRETGRQPNVEKGVTDKHAQVRGRGGA